MNAKTIIALQFAALMIMVGTAESLFDKLPQTILFIASIAAFAMCSIYISKNEKWLLKDLE